MNIGGLLPMPELMQALKANVESLPQHEKLTELDMTAMKPAMEGLMNKSLEDMNFPKESLSRLQDIFQHDNSDVWDAYVSKMANEAGEAGASAQDLDATIRELAENPDGDTQALDDYVAKIGNEQPVPGGLGGILGTQLLQESGKTMGDILESLKGSLEKMGELSEAQIDEAIDTAGNIAATNDNSLADLNQDIREHFDLPDHGDADLEVALADAGDIEIVQAEVADADADAVEIYEAEADVVDDDDVHDDVVDGEYYDGANDDPYTDATA